MSVLACELIGGPWNRVLEERRATVDAQLAALSAGTISAVMLPEGSLYMPRTPQRMERVVVTGEVPGVGTWIFNPSMITAAEIEDAAFCGTHGLLLGHLQSKQELYFLEMAGGTCDIVQAVATDGTVIQDSVVEHGNEEIIQQQRNLFSQRHPHATIRVVSEQECVAPRFIERQRHCVSAWERAVTNG